MTSPPSQRIGIVTCGAEKLADYFPTAAEPDFVPTEPPFTPDDQLLVDELRRRGHQVSAVVWGVETSRLTDRFDRLIVRSPWDYMDSDEQRQGFLRWLEQLAATGLVVENEPQVMLWLMDKRYLLDFAAVGVPIVPTQLIPLGESFDLETFVEQHVAAVIKPAVSAAGAGLEFLPDRQAARAFQQEFTDRCQRGAQLVQPFLPEIQTNGEWSLVYFGGEYSHGVHKLPARGQIMVHAERGGSLRFADPPSVVRSWVIGRLPPFRVHSLIAEVAPAGCRSTCESTSSRPPPADSFPSAKELSPNCSFAPDLGALPDSPS